jgi:hypothetical protein
MITIDPKTQNIIPLSRTENNNKKAGKSKFNAQKRLREAGHNEKSAGVADVGGMLFLQEIDEYTQDQHNLEEFAQKALKALKELQLELIKGKITGRRLQVLKQTIENSDFIINTPELSNIAGEIKLRLEVEIAKIEVNKDYLKV